MKEIANEPNLDMWIWLGDMAYVDKRVLKRHIPILERIRHFSLLQRVPFSSIIFGTKFLKVHEEDRRFLFNMTYSQEGKTHVFNASHL